MAKTFSDEDIQKVMAKADSILQKIGDKAKNLAYMGKNKKDEMKSNLDIPNKRVMIASTAAVALLTPISIPSVLGVGAIGAMYVGLNKLIKDSIKREYADIIKNSNDSKFWKLFSETKNEEIMNSLASAPEFAESNMQALARNKNATEDVLIAIYTKALASPNEAGKTVEGIKKIKEALLANKNTPPPIIVEILRSGNFSYKNENINPESKREEVFMMESSLETLMKKYNFSGASLGDISNAERFELMQRTDSKIEMFLKKNPEFSFSGGELHFTFVDKNTVSLKQYTGSGSVDLANELNLNEGTYQNAHGHTVEIEVVVPGPEEGTVIKSVLAKDENNQISEISSSIQPAGQA